LISKGGKEMTYMIPIGAKRKNYHKSSPGAVVAGLLIFLVFGIMIFLFFNRAGVFGFNYSIIFWIGGFMILLAIILATSAVMMSKPHTVSRNGNLYRRKVAPEVLNTPINPYKASNSENKNKEMLDNQDSEVEVINYCRYCGARKDLDAKFCHMCGTKF
jgi:hypothetical protein